MKTPCLLSLTTSLVALMSGIAYPAQSSQSSGQKPWQSQERTTGDRQGNAANTRVREEENWTNAARSSKDRRRALLSKKSPSNRNAQTRRAKSKDRLAMSRNKQALSAPAQSREQQASNQPLRSSPKNLPTLHQPTLAKPGADGIAGGRTTPVRPARGSAISGQQLMNARNRSATPAAIGGPAHTTKGTASIIGTAVNRTRLN